MVINDETREAIKRYLCDTINDIVKRKEIEYGKEEDVGIDLSKNPFHKAMLPKTILRASNFERSFSTTLGKTFEGCAHILAKSIFPVAIREFDLEGEISKMVLGEIGNMKENVKSKGDVDHISDANKIVKLSNMTGGESDHRKIHSDLYLRDADGNETFFEMKTPKPNKGQCLTSKEEHLMIHAIRRKSFPEVKTYVSMGYNPDGEGNEYTHSFGNTFLDIKGHVIMGRAFWEYVGGKGAYEEVLKCYKQVGEMKQSAIKKIIEMQNQSDQS